MLIVLVALAFIVVAVAVLLALMFFDVAFGTASTGSPPSIDVARWRPPLAIGKGLFHWASGVAETGATRKLQECWTPTAAHELVGDLHAGATAAIEQTREQMDSRATVGCPSYFHSMIAVTPPEAIRAADFVRKFRPAQVETVRTLALQNLKQTEGMDHAQYRRASMRCPLMGSNNACLAFSVRPLRCRGGCDLSEESSTCGNDGANEATAGADAAEFESRGRLVTQGAERGFSRALQSAGLDGDLYDLNGALVAALDTPDAAERWIHGERIFDNCRRYR